METQHDADQPARLPPRDYASAARAVVVTTFLGTALAAAAYWAWHQPFMAYPRALSELARMPAPSALPVPVKGVAARRVAETWGAPRGTNRRHEGVDIFAPRGTPVVSSTRGVVTSIRDQGLGGRQVWVLGPGGERHYYAHLDDWEPGLKAGDLVRPGSQLGVVGDSGNARGTPTHLHYGIYTGAGAVDPWPRLQAYAAAMHADASVAAHSATAPRSRRR